MRVTVVSASLSESSSGTALAKQVVDQINLARPAGSNPIEVAWVNLRELGHPLLDYLYSNVPTPQVRQAYEDVEKADLILAVTPTYQASYAGLFKLFWDMLPDGALRGKHVLLAATGGTGRHGLMIDHTLRPLFAYLGAIPLPTALFAATQDWGDPGFETEVGLEESLDKRIARAVSEVWSVAYNHRVSPMSEPKDPSTLGDDTPPESAAAAFPGFVDFESLLGRN